MAFRSACDKASVDTRFSYEPMLSGHLKKDLDLSLQLAGKRMSFPIWISSMTSTTMW